MDAGHVLRAADHTGNIGEIDDARAGRHAGRGGPGSPHPMLLTQRESLLVPGSLIGERDERPLPGIQGHQPSHHRDFPTCTAPGLITEIGEATVSVRARGCGLALEGSTLVETKQGPPTE